MLAGVQRRREFPTRATQALQVFAHRGLQKVFENEGPVEAPWQLQVVERVPGRKWAMGYLVGVGVRPEHVSNPEPGTPRPIWGLTKIAAAAGALLGAVAVTVRALRG